MSVIVKICGLSTEEALEVALDAGANMVGFVFFAPSPKSSGSILTVCWPFGTLPRRSDLEVMFAGDKGWR